MADDPNQPGPADQPAPPETPTAAYPPAAPPSTGQPQQPAAAPGQSYGEYPPAGQQAYAAAPVATAAQEPPEGWQAAYEKQKAKAGWLLISTVVLGVTTLLAGALALGLGVWAAASGGDRHDRVGYGMMLEGPFGDDDEGPFMGDMPGGMGPQDRYERRMERRGGQPLPETTPTPSPSSSPSATPTPTPTPSPTS